VARADVLDLVAQLGDRVNGHPEHVRDVLPQLSALLDEHHDPAVIAAIIDAFGKTWEEDANLQALPFADHSDPVVRLAVAQAIPGGMESRAATEAVMDALIRLSRDDVDEVRDWATFGIGSILELDTSAVRDALFARTTDRSQDVRDEALVGLAHRRDARALPLVREQLANANAGPLVFEAAQYLAQPSLLDALAGWVADKPDDDAILGAWRACDPAYQDTRTERQSALLASVERLMNEQGRPCRPALYCERSSTDVLLTVDVSSRVWVVDGLLERAGNDVDRAANLVALDIDRP
jgi:hypothetical protein